MSFLCPGNKCLIRRVTGENFFFLDVLVLKAVSTLHLSMSTPLTSEVLGKHQINLIILRLPASDYTVHSIDVLAFCLG